MYAPYEIGGPSRPTARATTFVKDENFLDDVDRHNDLRGRIVTYCVAGTFGLLSPMYLHASAATANWNINQIEIDDARAVSADALVGDSVRDIAHIRDVIKTSVSELARVFGVSRQAVHEWIKGGALAPRNALRLSELAQVADVFVESGIEVTPQVLRRKIGGGHSIMESVKEDGNVVGLARLLVDTLSRESQQRQRLATRLAGRQKPALAATDFGTPHLDENA